MWRVLRNCSRIIFVGCALLISSEGAIAADRAVVEQWGTFEISLAGPTNGNPFIDVSLVGRFSLGDKTVEGPGFYDGGGIYRIRFMPEAQGLWHYSTRSNVRELNRKSGEFQVVSPTAGNHGPVRVRNTYHFAYADGTPYRPIGTTSYNWAHMADALEEETLASLATAPFNKIRMCVFPKHQAGNTNELSLYPFEGTPPKTWDFGRFDPEFFRHLEKR